MIMYLAEICELDMRCRSIEDWCIERGKLLMY
jgi:hypothetical protein